MLSHNMDYFRQKPLELAKTTIRLDHGYHPETIQATLEQVYPGIMSKIQFEVAAKLSKPQKAAQGRTGFVPIAVRWVIERSNRWVERCKNLVKNFEWTLEHARTKLNLCFIRLMVKRLATYSSSQSSKPQYRQDGSGV
uniref:transposase n=1 Tax=Oculatella sp. LEGE 06141 TaxID=1828648 RepID=UPI001D14F298|nr:transposase [Oculatella sp. LEGE 06141]